MINENVQNNDLIKMNTQLNLGLKIKSIAKTCKQVNEMNVEAISSFNWILTFIPINGILL